MAIGLSTSRYALQKVLGTLLYRKDSAFHPLRALAIRIHDAEGPSNQYINQAVGPLANALLKGVEHL